jgi:gliding motility-associated-like protein
VVTDEADACSVPIVAFVGDSAPSMNGCEETIIRTYSVTDACGNTINVTQNLIRTIDSGLPTASNPTAIVLEGCNGSFPAPDVSVVADASDNCSTAVVAFVGDSAPTLVGCEETIIRTYSVTDACGNAINVTQSLIRTIDTTAPAFVEILPEIEISLNCDQIPTAAMLTAIDNCSGNVPVLFTETIINATSESYSIVRKWSAIDTCDNKTEFIQIINVIITNSLVNIFNSACNTDTSTIDLNSLLPQGTPGNGIWIDDNTGALQGSIFSSLGVPVGNYHFEYKINSTSCPRSIMINMNVNNECEGSVLGCGVIEVHNAFSPNGDGNNETFTIDNIDNISCYPENTVEIYNRWGILVYRTRNYNNSSNVFDGRSNVKKSSNLPNGTYFYILNYISFDGKGQTLTNKKDGYLYLIR